MSLLDKEIRRKVMGRSAAKVRIRLASSELNGFRLEAVGRYFATDGTAATVRAAFHYLASRCVNPTVPFFEQGSYERMAALFDLFDKGQTGDLRVTLLRWQVMAVADRVLENHPDAKTSEDLINAVIDLTKRDLDGLFF